MVNLMLGFVWARQMMDVVMGSGWVCLWWVSVKVEWSMEGQKVR